MENKSKSKLSRRKFLGSTATVAAFSLVPLHLTGKSLPFTGAATNGNPDSNFGGVHIGAITYSWRSMPGGIENIIKYCKETGISSIELMSNDLEETLGAPKNPMMGMFGPPPPPPKKPDDTKEAAAAPPPPPPPPRRRELTQEQKDAIAKYNQDMKTWRTSVPMSKVEAIRKMFDDAGIAIHIVKFSPCPMVRRGDRLCFQCCKSNGSQGRK